MDTSEIRAEISAFLVQLDQIDNMWKRLEAGEAMNDYTIERITKYAKKRAISLEHALSKFKKDVKI